MYSQEHFPDVLFISVFYQAEKCFSKNAYEVNIFMNFILARYVEFTLVQSVVCAYITQGIFCSCSILSGIL